MNQISLNTLESSSVLRQIICLLAMNLLSGTMFGQSPIADTACANLNHGNFANQSLTKANLQGANLHQADFFYADLKEANLSLSNLTNARLIGADLRGANLAGANLAMAYLVDANLSGAFMQATNLMQADLSYAKLDSTVLTCLFSCPSKLPEGFKCIVSRSDCHRNADAFEIVRN